MWTRTKTNNGVSRVLPILIFSFVFLFLAQEGDSFVVVYKAKAWIMEQPECQLPEAPVEVEFLYSCTDGILISNYTLPPHENKKKNETRIVSTTLVWRYSMRILRILQSRQNCYLGESLGKSMITCDHSENESDVVPINFILLVDVRHLHHGKCESFQNPVIFNNRFCAPLESKFVTIPEVSGNTGTIGDWTFSHFTKFIGFTTLVSMILTIYCRL